ncbi:hypothetical protein ET495_14525 [Xylanimonas allomyrinae]|uniref:Uncharacterized protein n=1 Tax=Xylanimonas allomyrinae TaxID=2509459 RepID=A0A4P6EUU4_9MICO|nr:hypothetical protein [Xylanimonas allomyrinae]QAY64227.1 hypothetical protein ET495_14525 [Xylanimonas allomyrinae]
MSQTLQDLAREAQDRSGASSMRQLARRAQENGFRIVGTTLSALAAGTYKSRPTPATIRAVAWLANVPESQAFAAAGEPLPGPPFAEELPPDVDHLSPRHRKVVVELLRVLIDDDLRSNGFAPAHGARRTQDPAPAGSRGSPGMESAGTDRDDPS